MQQTRSYWRLVAMAGVVSAFVASACVVTTSTDGETAGAAGTGTPGAGSSGTPSAGGPSAGAGTGGSHAGSAGAGGAGPVPYQCDPGEGGAVGTPNTCVPLDAATATGCDKCVQAKCCAEKEACYATDPGNQCGWGGPATADPDKAGEIYCIQACLIAVVDKNQTAPSDSDTETCANNCATTRSNGATTECGPIIGLQTSDMVKCLRNNCSLDCLGAE